MKKVWVILSLITIATIVSACSLIPGASTPAKKTTAQVDGGIFKSIDFGDHWKTVNVINAPAGQPAATLSNAEVVFLTFDPTNIDTVYVSTNGNGVYKSTNDGESWTATSLKTGKYPALTVDSRNTNVSYAITGNAIIKSVDDMTTWFTTYVETRPGQQLLDVIVDPKQPNVVYTASTSSILISKNYGNDWDLSDWKNTAITHLYLSEKNNQTLYAITAKGVSKSTDSAKTWVDLAPNLSTFVGATTIYWSTFDPKTETLLISTKYGLLRSTDGGTAWQEIITLFEHKKITVKPVMYSTTDSHLVVMAINNVIQKTFDTGNTWSSLKSIPTTRKIHYLINDPNHPDTVFAGVLRPAQ